MLVGEILTLWSREPPAIQPCDRSQVRRTSAAQTPSNPKPLVEAPTASLDGTTCHWRFFWRVTCLWQFQITGNWPPPAPSPRLHRIHSHRDQIPQETAEHVEQAELAASKPWKRIELGHWCWDFLLLIVRGYIYMYIYIYVYIYTCIYILMYICMCIYMYICIIYICIYTYLVQNCVHIVMMYIHVFIIYFIQYSCRSYAYI